MREAEQLIRPLEEVFNRKSVRNLRDRGVRGVVTLEVLITDLLAASKTKGISIYKLGAHDHEPEIDHYIVWPENKNAIPSLFVKQDVVHVLADELELFKETFM